MVCLQDAEMRDVSLAQATGRGVFESETVFFGTYWRRWVLKLSKAIVADFENNARGQWRRSGFWKYVDSTDTRYVPRIAQQFLIRAGFFDEVCKRAR